ncbi:MAG TPA: NAD-dependent DNA ligase, partial [Sphingomonadales bacterium]|nr:NAD-dependent DNA ligase [Sphingomonadales bacterium]
MAKGIIADDRVNEKEARFLQKWLVANVEANASPLVVRLSERIQQILKDKAFSQEEADELFETLQHFSGGDFQLGEILKATSLPLDRPQPKLVFQGRQFCFTGTFAYGSRRDCENVVNRLGGYVGSLTKKTNYLVI